MAEHTFRRMEKKIIIEKAVISSLQEKLSHFMVPDIYNTNGKPYMICNLYFDDAWNQVIRTSVERPIYKEKLRLRSYGVPQDGSTVFLELKKKYRASLVITEYAPGTYSYTKQISLIFDAKKHYIIQTYRRRELGQIRFRDDLYIFPY